MNWTGIILFTVYLVIFFGGLVAVIAWDRWRRRTKQPFPENLRLLRMPGEYLWRRVIQTDDADLQWWSATMLIPIIVGGIMLQIDGLFFRSSPIWGLVLAIVGFAFSLLLSIQCIQKRLQKRDDTYLGFFGERYVAEWLDPLKSQGWFIFHDVPCEGATGKFNIDHVAVGPNGIWVVETKTRRKGKAREGRQAHVVESDGTKLTWPWGEETEPIAQAANNAAWLRDWLATLTGKTYEIFPVLTFPGWWVTERKLGGVRAANPKTLAGVFLSRPKDSLKQEDIDLVRRQLEARCRNVEY